MRGADKLCVAATVFDVEPLGNALQFLLVVGSFSSGLFFGQAALAVGTLLQ